MKNFFSFLLTFGLLLSAPFANAQDCTPPTDLAVTVEGHSATISWSEASPTGQYAIELAKVEAGDTTVIVKQAVEGHTYTAINLEVTKSYVFHILTSCIATTSQSNWSSDLSFTVEADAVAELDPAALSLVADGMGTSAKLAWTDLSAEVSYRVEVKNAQGNNSTFSFKQTTADPAATVIGLKQHKKYKFRVKILSETTASEWSDWTLFNSGALSAKTTEPTTAFSLTAYPNPANELLNIRLTNPTNEPATVELRNAMGQVVQTETLQANEPLTVAVNHLPAGFYTVVARVGTDVRVQKIVIR